MQLITKHEFHEIWPSDSQTLLKGVNQFLSVLSTFIVRFV